MKNRRVHNSEEFYFVGERVTSKQKPQDAANPSSAANPQSFTPRGANGVILDVEPTIVPSSAVRDADHSKATREPTGNLNLSDYADECYLAFINDMNKGSNPQPEHQNFNSSFAVVQKPSSRERMSEATTHAVVPSLEELVDESYRLHLDFLVKSGKDYMNAGSLSYDVVDDCYREFLNSLKEDANVMVINRLHCQNTSDSLLELVDQNYQIYLNFIEQGGTFVDVSSCYPETMIEDRREENGIQIKEKNTVKVKIEEETHPETQNLNFFVIPDVDAEVIELTKKERNKTLITINDDGESLNIISLKSSLSEANLNYQRAFEEHLKQEYNEHELRNLLKLFRLRSPVVGSKDLRSGCKTFNLPVEGASYEDYYEDLADIIWESSDKAMVLKLLRGFFYWLSHVAHGNMPPPWKDPNFFATKK